ncbi:MAG: M48 family metalloprotease [Pseudomonadales bacterium]
MKYRAWVLIALLASSGAVAATSPLFMSERKELELGKAEHEKIVAAFGYYQDEALQNYVDKVGQRIAAQSDRSDMDYTFTVLDDEMVNAMALPGGYIYITRGMLMHMNSEAELAAVLGHEIAHVTEKHAIKSQRSGKVLEVLSQVAAVATGTPAAYELGSIFGGVLLSGYSREHELEADKVGAKYMARAGYSPEAMLETIEILKAKDRIEVEQARAEDREPRIYHGFLSTHPDHDTRYKEVIRESSNLVEDYDEFIKTDEFLEQLNGLHYGPRRQVGIVRGNTFYHPKLGIKLSFPENWRIESSGNSVQFVSQVEDAIVSLSTGRLAKGVEPKEYLQERVGLDLREGREVTVGGLPGYLGIADRADTPFGRRPVRVVILYDQRRGIAYILRGAGKHDLRNLANDRDFIATIFSFDRMNREDFRRAKRPKIQVVRAEESTTMESLAKQSPITNYSLDKLRVMNGLYPHGQPEPGELIKIVD